MNKELSEYERGVIDGRQIQMQSSVDKAVNAMSQSQRTWVGLTDVLDFIEEFTGAERERHPMFSDGYDLALSHVKELVEAKLKENT